MGHTCLKSKRAGLCIGVVGDPKSACPLEKMGAPLAPLSVFILAAQHATLDLHVLFVAGASVAPRGSSTTVSLAPY